MRTCAGAEGAPASGLEPRELFLSERLWRVYRSDGWKSYRRRTTGAFRLVDLEAAPEELHDVASRHPEVVEAQRRRIAVLSEAPAAPNATAKEIHPRCVELLQAQGYVE